MLLPQQWRTLARESGAHAGGHETPRKECEQPYVGMACTHDFSINSSLWRQHGGIAICAAVSPYEQTRNEVRHMVGTDHFVEVFVDTPLEVCKQRDAKGMYAKARRGQITGFTGIDDPYEPPSQPEITLETVMQTAEENARGILAYLTRRGFVRAERPLKRLPTALAHS